MHEVLRNKEIWCLQAGSCNKVLSNHLCLADFDLQIEVMKEMYLPEISEMYQRFASYLLQVRNHFILFLTQFVAQLLPLSSLSLQGYHGDGL